MPGRTESLLSSCRVLVLTSTHPSCLPRAHRPLKQRAGHLFGDVARFQLEDIARHVRIVPGTSRDRHPENTVANATYDLFAARVPLIVGAKHRFIANRSQGRSSRAAF